MSETHTEEFSDKWAIDTVATHEYLLLSLTISGSDASDGTFDSPVHLVVTGARWTATMEFLTLLGGGPLPPGTPLQPGGVRRLVRYDLADGLVKIFTDVPFGFPIPDEGPHEGSPVLICKSLDPNVNPFAGATNPYDFTFDPDILHEPKPEPCGPKNEPCKPKKDPRH